MDPLTPLDNTPKNGDFVAYIEALERQRPVTSTDPGSPPGFVDNTMQRVRQSTRAAEAPVLPSSLPPSSLPPSSAAARAAANAASTVRARSSAPHSPAAASPTGDDVASEIAQRRRLLLERFLPSGQARSESPGELLRAVLQPYLRTISRTLMLIAVVWFVLGAVFDIRPFADSVPVALLLFFVAVFVFNQRDRKPPRPSA